MSFSSYSVMVKKTRSTGIEKLMKLRNAADLLPELSPSTSSACNLKSKNFYGTITQQTFSSLWAHC